MLTLNDAELSELVCQGRALEKGAIDTLVDYFEDTRAETSPMRARINAELLRQPGQRRRSVTVGITGMPGSEKSSLLAKVVPSLLAKDPSVKVAILYADRSHCFSQGIPLEDRTWTQFQARETRAYVRPQNGVSTLGGLTPATFQACGLLTGLFDLTLVETVGVGPGHLDIRLLADHVCFVLQPLGGGELPFLEKGRVGMPDSFLLAVNGEPSATECHRRLVTTLAKAGPFRVERPPVLRADAKTEEGIGSMVDLLLEVIGEGSTRDPAALAHHALGRWVRDEWGRVGEHYLVDQLGGAARWVRLCRGYERAQSGLAMLLSSSSKVRLQPSVNEHAGLRDIARDHPTDVSE
jgi:putative protein kinase ArgK-like GTPase of G3E family